MSTAKTQLGLITRRRRPMHRRVDGGASSASTCIKHVSFDPVRPLSPSTSTRLAHLTTSTRLTLADLFSTSLEPKWSLPRTSLRLSWPSSYAFPFRASGLILTGAMQGATGNQGGSVFDHLAASDKPYRLRAITRDPTKPNAEELRKKGGEVVAGDLDDKASIEKAFAGADIVFVRASPRPSLTRRNLTCHL